MTDLYNLELRDRPYLTKVRKKPNSELQVLINELGHRHLKKLEEDTGTVTFWDVNSTIYVAAITSQKVLNDLKAAKPITHRQSKPGWIRQLEHRIDCIRRKISQISVVIQCSQDNTFSKHQKSLLIKFKRMFGNAKLATLTYRLQLLKHDLRTCSEKLKYKVTVLTRKSKNSRFAVDPKSAYRQMRGESFTVKSTPTQQSLESYWSTQWGQTAKLNANAQWLPDIRSSYCSEVMQSSYEVTEATLKQVLSNTGNNKSPGPDGLVAFWYKNLQFHIPYLATLYNSCLDGRNKVPDWLSEAKTRLIPKCHQTHLPNNYRPIALLNVMYKLYTGCLNCFLDELSRSSLPNFQQNLYRP